MPLLPDGRGQLLEEPDYFGPRTFLRMALQRFPQLAEDLDEAGRAFLNSLSAGIRELLT